MTCAILLEADERQMLGRLQRLTARKGVSSISIVQYRSFSAAPAKGGANAKARPSVLVWGGSGALGQAMIQKFKAGGWATLSVDYNANESADRNILLDPKQAWTVGVEAVKSGLAATGGAGAAAGSGGVRFGAMISAAGGWAGERLSADGFLAGADRMLQQNVSSSFAIVHLASRYLSEGGVCVLTGSAACVDPTPGMISYGVSKAAVHHLIRSVAASASTKSPQLPKGAAIAGILPITIDTPTNREFMPNAKFDDWTLPQVFASRVLEWADRRQPPVNGGLYIFDTKNGSTDVRLHAVSTADTSAPVDV